MPASATIRKAPIILGLGMAFLTVAALTGGGVAALAGSDPVTISKLGKGVVEGVVEGSTHVANSAQWVASKIGTTANSLPGSQTDNFSVLLNKGRLLPPFILGR